MIDPVKFKTINDIYYLRSAPIIDDTTVNERYDATGNRIGTLSKGTKGIAYKSSTDNTGRIWWLIETEPLDSLSASAFYDTKDFPTSYIGWTSSRYLEVLVCIPKYGCPFF